MSTLQVACKGDAAVEDGLVGALGLAWLLDVYWPGYGTWAQAPAAPPRTGATRAKDPPGQVHHLWGPEERGRQGQRSDTTDHG